MRRRVIAGNWKMYKTMAETQAFFEAFLPVAQRADYCDMVVAPPFTSIAAAVEAARGRRLGLVGRTCTGRKKGRLLGRFLRGCFPRLVVST